MFLSDLPFDGAFGQTLFGFSDLVLEFDTPRLFIFSLYETDLFPLFFNFMLQYSGELLFLNWGAGFHTRYLR